MEAGEVPSRSRLRVALKVGADRAKVMREALEQVNWPALVKFAATDTVRDVTMLRRVALEIVTGRPDPADNVNESPAVSETEPAEPAEPAESTPEPDRADLPSDPNDVVAVEQSGVPATADDHGPVVEVAPQPTPSADPVGSGPDAGRLSVVKPVRSWPVLLLALPAFVAIWSGWVGLGELTGFGIVHPLPGIADRFALNSAITLPIGVETYAAFALRVWLSAGMPDRARRFARWSAIGSLTLGAAGQVAYHLMSAAHVTSAPWEITTLVAALPVAVLGMGAALAHLIRTAR
jgi:hypothetical protein